ncbi:flagellar hook-length control protein FliK [Vibrio astriarenae]
MIKWGTSTLLTQMPTQLLTHEGVAQNRLSAKELKDITFYVDESTVSTEQADALFNYTKNSLELAQQILEAIESGLYPILPRVEGTAPTTGSFAKSEHRLNDVDVPDVEGIINFEQANIPATTMLPPQSSEKVIARGVHQNEMLDSLRSELLNKVDIDVSEVSQYVEDMPPWLDSSLLSLSLTKEQTASQPEILRSGDDIMVTQGLLEDHAKMAWHQFLNAYLHSNTKPILSDESVDESQGISMGHQLDLMSVESDSEYASSKIVSTFAYATVPATVVANDGLKLSGYANVFTPSEVTINSHWQPLTAIDKLSESVSRTLSVTQDVDMQRQLYQVIKDKIQLHIDINNHQARIRLDPPELGKIELVVRVEADRLNVQLTATSSATREAITATSEKLRLEILDQNTNLTHVDIDLDKREGRKYVPLNHQNEAQGSDRAESVEDLEEDVLEYHSYIIRV